MSIDALNNTPNPKEKFLLTPMDKFSNTIVATKTKFWHPFSCPAYVLREKLQSTERVYHKW